MPLGLHVAIGVGGLPDAGVPELALDPADVGAALEQPGRARVPCRVVLPIGELGAAQQELAAFPRK